MVAEIEVSTDDGVEIKIEDEMSNLFLVETICDNKKVQVIQLYFSLPDGKVMVTINPKELDLINMIKRDHTFKSKSFIIVDGEVEDIRDV